MKIIKLIVILCLMPIATISYGQCLQCTGNTASGYKSTAIGYGSFSIGDYSFASGLNCTSNGISAISMGKGCTSGTYGFAAGRGCVATANSVAIGDYAIVNVEASLAIGHYVQSNADGAFVIGSANNSDPLINGISSSLMVGFQRPFPTLFVGPPASISDEFGKVGIGTIEPAATLDVNGGVKCQEFTLEQRYIKPGWVLATIDEEGNSAWMDPQVANLWILNESGDIYRPEGNVGIGIENPTSKLEVRGQVSIGYHEASLGDNDLIVEGNVGIGTSNPLAKLDIKGETRTQEFQMTEGCLNGYIMQSDNEGNATWVDPSLINDGDWTLLGNNLYVGTGRYIGIGKTIPTQALDVVGNMNLTGYIYGNHNDWQPLKIFGGSDETDGSYIALHNNYDNNASVKLFARGNSGSIQFHNYQRQIMTIAADNNVYIGNNSESDISNLIVYGEIKSHLVRVTSDIPWHDYVFEKDYDLMSLNQLEDYIRQHKHLPDIPSEEEVHEEGLDIAEMNALLLKKVEELTLYIIEQEKRIEMLELEINK